MCVCLLSLVIKRYSHGSSPEPFSMPVSNETVIINVILFEISFREIISRCPSAKSDEEIQNNRKKMSATKNRQNINFRGIVPVRKVQLETSILPD